MRSFEQQRRWVWETMAHIEWGHEFRVDDDLEWQTCRTCGTRMRNDGQFNWPGRCPRYWDGDTLREPPDDYLAHVRDAYEAVRAQVILRNDAAQ